MKNVFIGLLFLGSAAFLVYALFERVNSKSDEAEAKAAAEAAAATYRFPDDVTIARKDGSSLDVRLTGRNETHIQFERLSDQMAFTFEITELDTLTQKLIQNYPKANFVAVEEPEVEAPATVESIYIEQLKQEIEKIDDKLLDLQVEYASATNNADRRAMQREGQELNNERLRLSAEVAKRTGEELERRKPTDLRKKY